MQTKEQILKSFGTDYKPCFLLAWLRYLTYEEMKGLNMLEPYDAAKDAKQVKSTKEWDNLVIKYTRENLLNGLCILMRKFYGAIIEENWTMSYIYLDDVIHWLHILDDNEFDNINGDLSSKQIKEYYYNISKKYKIDL